MGPFLFGSLIALCEPYYPLHHFLRLIFCGLVGTGLVAAFLPFNRTLDLVMAIGGCLIFSGYIVYDTYIINKRLSPDEFIMGAISLYLECVVFSC